MGYRFLVYAFIFMTMNLMGQTVKPEENKAGEVTTDNSIESLVLSSNSLAFQIYDQLKRGEDNLVLSPYSLTIALGMVYAGADGSTQSQMARVLRFPLRAESLSGSFARLTKMLAKSSKYGQELVLNNANALWIQSGHPILPAFMKSIVDDYKGAVKTADFATKAEDVRIEINGWVNDRTQGKITEMLRRGEIPNITRMLLISTLYMQGKWLKPFDSKFTLQTPFFPGPSRSMTVPMMTVTSTFLYLKEGDLSILELPYDSRKTEGLELVMYVLLPQDTYGLAKLENLMDASRLNSLLERMQQKKVVVSLPKFKVVSTLAFEEILSQLGMVAPFSDNADFSKIDGLQDLKLSNIVQKTFVSVDERGTEAAGVSGVSFVTKAALDSGAPELFVADHPFMFFIVEKTSRAILFMGKVSSPD